MTDGYLAFVSSRVLSEAGAPLPAKVAAAVRHAVHPLDAIRGPVLTDNDAEVFEAECFRLVTVDLREPFDPAAPTACARCAEKLTDPDGTAAAARKAQEAEARRERNSARQRAARAAATAAGRPRHNHRWKATAEPGWQSCRCGITRPAPGGGSA